jgi:hypothetical protein
MRMWRSRLPVVLFVVAVTMTLAGCTGTGSGDPTCAAGQLICYEDPANTSGPSVCCPSGYPIYDPSIDKCVSSSYGYSGTYWNCFSQ